MTAAQRHRKGVGLATALLVSLPALVLAAPSASHAQEGSIRCDTSGTARFSPPVFLAPQQTTMRLDGRKHTCTDDAGEVESGTLKASVSGRMSCFKSPEGVSGKATFTWRLRGGGTAESTADVRLTGSTLNNGALEGTITRGYREGQTVHVDASVDLLDAGFKCMTGGVSSASFDGSFTIG